MKTSCLRLLSLCLALCVCACVSKTPRPVDPNAQVPPPAAASTVSR